MSPLKILTIAIVSFSSFSHINAQDQITRELRLVQPAVPQAPLVLRSSASATSQQNITLPAVLPSVGQVLQASAVSGSDVTTAWTTPSGGGGATVVFARRTTDIADGGGYTTGLSVTLTANKVYTFTARLILQRGDAGFLFRFTNGTGTMTSCSYAFTRHIDAIGAASVEGGYDGDGTSGEDLTLSAAGATNHFVLTGMIVMSATGGTVNLEFNKSGGPSAANMLTGSFIQLTEMP